MVWGFALWRLPTELRLGAPIMRNIVCVILPPSWPALSKVGIYPNTGKGNDLNYSMLGAISCLQVTWRNGEG